MRCPEIGNIQNPGRFPATHAKFNKALNYRGIFSAHCEYTGIESLCMYILDALRLPIRTKRRYKNGEGGTTGDVGRRKLRHQR
jgi:hypothetical protein